MFDRLFAMMGGELEELPRRRGGAISFDPTVGAFVADDPPAVGEPWLGRGELPGPIAPVPPSPRALPAAASRDESVADEMRRLAGVSQVSAAPPED